MRFAVGIAAGIAAVAWSIFLIKALHKLLIRLLLRWRPSLLSFECRECGKPVELYNLDNHYAYFHPATGQDLAPAPQLQVRL